MKIVILLILASFRLRLVFLFFFHLGISNDSFRKIFTYMITHFNPVLHVARDFFGSNSLKFQLVNDRSQNLHLSLELSDLYEGRGRLCHGSLRVTMANFNALLGYLDFRAELKL